MKAIGLTGKAGAGKDTAAQFILNKYPKFKSYAFADPIRELAKEWLGLTEAHYHRDIKESMVAFDTDEEWFLCLDILIYEMFRDRHQKVTPITAKRCANNIIQTLSQDSIYSKVRHPDESRITRLVTSPRKVLQVIGTEGFRQSICDTFWVDIAPKENVIITDVRFDNEAEAIRSWGGELIEIMRTNQEAIPEGAHASENGISEKILNEMMAPRILNDKSLVALENEVLSTVEDLL